MCSVLEDHILSGRAADPTARPDLLIEVPHGATRPAHYEAVRARLVGTLPDHLEQFFFVNTDVGSPECAVEIARLLTSAQSRLRVRVIRGLVPRTFIDCNRLLDQGSADDAKSGITPGLPGYISHPDDVEFLTGLHRRYLEVAEEAYEQVCGSGGMALDLHTYAPRSVDIGGVDHDVVRKLRKAYTPGTYENWPKRPAVDIISKATDGTNLARKSLVSAVRDTYAAIEIQVEENATYTLHPATAGHRYSARHPGRVLCLEINRELLADPFVPFEEMEIASSRVERMSTPIAEAYRRELAS